MEWILFSISTSAPHLVTVPFFQFALYFLFPFQKDNMMGSILLGLIAALAWGVHDTLVRYVGQTIGILRSLFLVLLIGFLIQAIATLTFTESIKFSSLGLLYSITAGAFFAVACIGHYNAFAKGPVKLVAPLIGTYSVATFIIAAALGSPISLAQWLAGVFLVLGIGLVARADNTEENIPPSINLSKLLFFCALAVVGFTATFSFGQAASSIDGHLSSGLITRLTAILIIGTILISKDRNLGNGSVWPSRNGLLVLGLMGALDAIALGVVLAAGLYSHPEFASAISACFGLITVILAWLFLMERINKFQWVGILTVFASIVYLSAS